MRRFTLVGAALLLLVGSASAQQVYKVTDHYDCRTKTTTIERVDCLPCVPPCPPKSPLCCLLPDQPALLYRLSVMNALHLSGIDIGIGGAIGPLPRLDDLPRPGGNGQPRVPRLDDLPRPAAPEGKSGLVPTSVDALPAPHLDCPARPPVSPLLVWLGLDAVVDVRPAAGMITLCATDWYCGRCFTDDTGRRWCLLKGCALPAKLPRMRGWLLESDAKLFYFVHETGNIYTRVANVPVP